MRRRRFLALTGAATGGLAGCVSAPRAGDDGRGSAAVDLPVPPSEMRAPLPRDYIPAIVEPSFGDDWAGLRVPDTSAYDGGPLLPDDAPVIGVERAGEARAYPLRVLDWHEVVNDDLGGPLLVSYCPLCGSGVTARRTVNGIATRFGVSGRLWRRNLLMYDELTGSLWSQIAGMAVRGPRTAERLSLLPSSLTTWGEWRGTHPDAAVLLPPPRSNTLRGRDATFDYFAPKYPYRGEDQIVGADAESGERLHPRALVVGVTADGAATAYPFDVVRERGAVNDVVGDLPVVVVHTPDGSLAAYVRRVGGTTLVFEPAGESHVRAGRSRWRRTTGRAVDGPYGGRRLAPAADRAPMFWRAWSDFYPDTAVYRPGRGADG